jgi:hypothetical protein
MAQLCFRRVSSWRSFGFVLPPGPFVCAQWSCTSTRGSGMGVHGLAQMLAMAALHVCLATKEASGKPGLPYFGFHAAPQHSFLLVRCRDFQ